MVTKSTNVHKRNVHFDSVEQFCNFIILQFSIWNVCKLGNDTLCYKLSLVITTM